MDECVSGVYRGDERREVGAGFPAPPPPVPGAETSLKNTSKSYPGRGSRKTGRDSVKQPLLDFLLGLRRHLANLEWITSKLSIGKFPF